MSEQTSLKIIENYEILGQGKVIIQAFTGSGLVASIVAHHLIDKLQLVEKGYISSSLIPSVGLVRNGVIHRPIRIFENDTYLLVVSEVGISQENLNEFIESLFIWYNSLDPGSIVVVGALPTGRPSDANKLRYNIVTSDLLTKQYIKEKGIKTMSEGGVYGSVALSLMEAKRFGISSFAILSHCIATIPDYLAAKNVIELFQVLLNEEISLDPLDRNAIDLKEHLIRKRKNKSKNKLDKFDDSGEEELFDDFDSDDDDDEDDLSRYV